MQSYLYKIGLVMFFVGVGIRVMEPSAKTFIVISQSLYLIGALILLVSGIAKIRSRFQNK